MSRKYTVILNTYYVDYVSIRYTRNSENYFPFNENRKNYNLQNRAEV